MAERVPCSFSLIRYVPDVVKGEFANIGVVLQDTRPSGATMVRFTRDWSRVRCLDPSADVELLESLEAEIGEQLRVGVSLTVNAKPVLATLEDTLSNSVQLTAMQGTLAEDVHAEMEQLLRMYVEPLRAPAGRRVQTGRAALTAEMRRSFERVGVWGLMRKKISAAQYTQVGDPLRLDCGYRNGMVKIFHAVSLLNDLEVAKGLAYSANALRTGVHRVEGAELQLTAVVEPANAVEDGDQYKFGVSVMELAAIRVLTSSQLVDAAEVARQELRV